MQENLSFDTFLQECLQELMRGSIGDDSKPLHSLIIKTQYAISQISGLDSTKKDIFNNLVKSINTPLKIAIIGQFSSGKSTFLNALLGEEILPSGITPVTAKVCEIVYGTHISLEVVYKNGDIIGRDIAFLNEVDEMENLKISYYKLYAPLDLLKTITFLDTPGFNSQNQSDTDTTNSILESVDGIIWLTLIDNVGKNSEKQILQSHISKYANKSICVLNQKDRLKNQAEIDASIEYAKSTFSAFFDSIIAISAKMALDSIKTNNAELYKESNIESVINYINNSIYTKTEETKAHRIASNLKAIVIREKNALHRMHIAYRDLDNILKIIPQKLRFNFLQSGLEERFKKLFVAIESRFDSLSSKIFNSFELKRTDIVKEGKNRFGFKTSITHSKDINVLPKERLLNQLCNEEGEFILEFKKLGFSLHEFAREFSEFALHEIKDFCHELEEWCEYAIKRLSYEKECDNRNFSMDRIYKDIYIDYEKSMLDIICELTSQLSFLQHSLSYNVQNAIMLCLERLYFEVENALSKHRVNQDLPLYNPTLENTRNLINQGLHYSIYQDRLSLGFSIYERALWNLSQSFNDLYEEKSCILQAWIAENTKHMRILESCKDSILSTIKKLA